MADRSLSVKKRAWEAILQTADIACILRSRISRSSNGCPSRSVGGHIHWSVFLTSHILASQSSGGQPRKTMAMSSSVDRYCPATAEPQIVVISISPMVDEWNRRIHLMEDCQKRTSIPGVA